MLHNYCCLSADWWCYFVIDLAERWNVTIKYNTMFLKNFNTILYNSVVRVWCTHCYSDIKSWQCRLFVLTRKITNHSRKNYMVMPQKHIINASYNIIQDNTKNYQFISMYYIISAEKNIIQVFDNLLFSFNILKLDIKRKIFK